MSAQRYFLVALAVCAVLYTASRGGRKITPASREVAIAAEGSFTRDGQYPGEAFADAVNVRGWGSWSGSDDNQGTLAIGPFPAPRILRFGASGYPNNEGNELFVERTDTAARLPIKIGPIGERWRVIDFELPPNWQGQPVRLIAIDHATGLGGWLALTEPIRGGRSDGNNALLETLTAWAINGVLLGLIYFAAARWLAERKIVPPEWVPLGAGAIVALCGYATFWAYFGNPLLGKIVSWAMLAGGAGTCFWKKRGDPLPEVSTVTRLVLTVGAFYLALLHLFPTQHDFYTLAANRYREDLPVDNVISHALAQRLFIGEPAKKPGDDWQSSDRPPLQTGWQLLTIPAAKVLKLDRQTASATAAVWFQLLWVAGGYGLLRTLGMARRRAGAWTLVCGLSGFFVQNTTFTWPKLSAAAFACGAFALWVLSKPESGRRSHLLSGAAFAALGLLSHGGVAFSFLAMAPWIFRDCLRGKARAWLGAAAVVALLLLPWVIYQKVYDPPGDRLLKWHLAGVQPRDARGTWQTIHESYRAKTWGESLKNKVSNVRLQLAGETYQLFDISKATRVDRRTEEFFYTGRGLTWWPVLALIAMIATRRKLFSRTGDGLATLAGWCALTVVAWCLLLFSQDQAVIHQGSYALMIGLFVFCSVVLERAGRGWLIALAALQTITLATTWAVGNATIQGPATGWLFLLLTGAVLACSVWAGFRKDPAEIVSPAEIPNAPTPSRRYERIAAWWQNPQLNLWVLLGLAVLLFLRKPHALHTPQLWAEDGSIFLMQNDAHRAGAWFLPYMGYLHLLPRLIAYAASHLLDPAWWPAFYNGVSFAIWVAVLTRLFSPRFDLPGKPWLALAFFLGPNTGEVLFNITNLQWLTAFVLLQQVLIARPVNPVQRCGDLALVALAGLTGPFIIVFAPLFAWRWWRDRQRDNLALLLVVGACAAAQAWFVVRTGEKFDYQSAPFHFIDTLNVVARRLVAWPVAGDTLALELPAGVVGAVGGAFIAAVLIRALRPDAQRGLRLTVVAAFGLILLAGIYRTRPDTWPNDNLVYADRYFYIPRVLLAWLLIWEFNALPRAIAVGARLACLAAVMVHLRDYQVRAPLDYHWAEHVEPIRRGEPANLPTLPEGWTLEYRGRPQKN